MKIEILGTGCYNCVKPESLIDGVLGELGSTRSGSRYFVFVGRGVNSKLARMGNG